MAFVCCNQILWGGCRPSVRHLQIRCSRLSSRCYSTTSSEDKKERIEPAVFSVFSAPLSSAQPSLKTPLYNPGTNLLLQMCLLSKRVGFVFFSQDFIQHFKADWDIRRPSFTSLGTRLHTLLFTHCMSRRTYTLLLSLVYKCNKTWFHFFFSVTM